MRLSQRIAGALALAVTLFAPVALAARPTIAVLPFSIDKRVVITDGRSVLTGTIEDQTSLLSNELIHQLVATRKFDVLERSRVDDLLREKEFQESDYASPEEAPKLAKLLGADYFVLGRIDDLAGRSEEKQMPYSTRSYLQQEAHIDLYLRVIDARTGRIVAAEKFASEAKLRDPKGADNVGKKLIAQAAQEMVGRIVGTVFPLRVAKSEGRTLYINRGNDGTLKVGDALAVYSQGEAIVDQDTGEALGNTENEVARATVTAVEARFTKAELAGEATVSSGMLVKKLPADAKPAAPAELPPGPRW
ncbi:MAG: penicillin-binding protein activator LpoB [Moraxellaceae bacterium]|jgi:curli biogenesis system outer membrane secretion channel CsgG|nr:penicillin-binding protein activator LpoB [Moraxellaceae bacterium]